MKVLIAIDAPDFSAGWGRREQSERVAISDMLKLLASRVELGQSDGFFTGNGGATLHWKIEPAVSAAETEAA